MTSERPRFPLVLTVFAALGFAVCCGLGVWQLQRAAWKAQELSRYHAVETGPPAPIATVLTAASRTQDAAYRRVHASCTSGAPEPARTRLSTDNGEWVTRALSFCQLSGASYAGVFVDRGVVTASRGSTTQAQIVLPTPVTVIGTLEHLRGDCFGSDGCNYQFGNLGEAAPYVLVAESESPAPPGVAPAPFPDAADNLHYVGAYWLTWFGLAGALAAIYAAVLWRRYHPKR